MEWLKTDVHSHSGDDRTDDLPYSSEMLIESAAASGVDVLAITGHRGYPATQRLARYAERRGILLLPGVELLVEGKHVLMLNPCAEQWKVKTFRHLHAIRGRGELIIAPHPYFPSPTSLGACLLQHIHCFDAIEYCSFYIPAINFNRKAIRVAQQHGLPCIATSDHHGVPYENTNFTFVQAEKTPSGVVEALRAGRIRLETKPLSYRRLLDGLSKIGHDAVRRIMGLHGEEAIPA